MSKFVWEPNERLWPIWMFVLCPECGDAMLVEADPKAICVMCRIKQRLNL